MSNGHFEYWKLDADGAHIGTPIRCKNVGAVLLQCHPQAIAEDILHLCEIATVTPDYPVVLTAWRRYDVTIEGTVHEQKSLLWSAEIYWRTK